LLTSVTDNLFCLHIIIPIGKEARNRHKYMNLQGRLTEKNHGTLLLVFILGIYVILNSIFKIIADVKNTVNGYGLVIENDIVFSR